MSALVGTVALADDVVTRLGAPVRPTGVGIVHLGIGAFHRAHQAVFTQAAMRATCDGSWGILGVTQRSPHVRDLLRAQGCLYTVVTADGDDLSAELVGAVVDVAWPGDETRRIIEALAAESTHVVTLTVTEKGYTRGADGHLDLAVCGADLATGLDVDVPSTTAIGLLVRGLVARHAAGGTPLTVLSCDNLPSNGRLLRGLVDDALRHLGDDALREWVATSVTFPSSMVDRIVPATTPEWVERAERFSGVRDEAVVVAESFAQWVIEDDFAGPRPAWEVVGATFTDDVEAYERMKLRLLNGAHSAVAYAGLRRGHETVADAIADADVRTLVADVQAEARRSLDGPADVDLVAYSERVLERFANRAMEDTTRRISADGTQKTPIRWGAVAAELDESPAIDRAFDEWARFIVESVQDGVEFADPRADELAEAVRAAASPEAAVAAVLASVR